MKKYATTNFHHPATNLYYPGDGKKILIPVFYRYFFFKTIDVGTSI
jgi:hypothetical protein